MTYEFGMFVH